MEGRLEGCGSAASWDWGDIYRYGPAPQGPGLTAMIGSAEVL